MNAGGTAHSVSTCLQVCCTNLRLSPDELSGWTLNPLRLICRLFCWKPHVLAAVGWMNWPPTRKAEAADPLMLKQLERGTTFFKAASLDPFSPLDLVPRQLSLWGKMEYSCRWEKQSTRPHLCTRKWTCYLCSLRWCLCKTPGLGCGQRHVVFKIL